MQYDHISPLLTCISNRVHKVLRSHMVHVSRDYHI